MSAQRLMIAIFTLLLTLPAVARPESDPRAVEIAESVLESMGGQEAWSGTRYLEWRFLGRRQHHWDRGTGDVRIESEDRLILMNLWDRTGRVWDGGVELPEGPDRDAALELGYAWWVNDSYWLLMPFKLLDPGVTLGYEGEAKLPDGRAADLLAMTFENVGLTPENRYEIWVARDTGLVEQWAYYDTASDAEPKFTLPWSGWQRFGAVLIATDHGRDSDWEIAAPAELPRSLFENP